MRNLPESRHAPVNSVIRNSTASMRSATARESTRHTALFCVGAGQWDQTIYHHTHSPRRSANRSLAIHVTKPLTRPAYTGPTCGDAAGSAREAWLPPRSRRAVVRVSAAGEADGESLGFGLAGGSGGGWLVGGAGGLDEAGGDEGCCGGAEGPPALPPPGRGGFWGRGRPPGVAAGAPGAEPLGLAAEDAPGDGLAPCLPERPLPAPAETAATPSDSTAAPSRPTETDGLGAFPSSLTLMQPADAATTSAVTARRAGADNWRTGGLRSAGGAGSP